MDGDMSIVRLGRAILDGQATSLVQIDGVVFRMRDLLDAAILLPNGSLDPIFQNWSDWVERLSSLDRGDARPIEVPYEAFLAPVVRPLHLLCIGTNYRDHIAEMGIPTNPEYPYAFLKPITTISAPAGPVTLPNVSTMVDWEAELGIVIGRVARSVALNDALNYVAGYVPLNDVSARDWVENRPNLGIDWVMQKASDGFTPMGPWVTLSNAVADPQGLPIRCAVAGETMQNSSTGNMLFSVAEIIAHVSRFMTLSPGDVIATGTPAGVGFGMKPRRFISDGDVVSVSIGDLGELRTRFVAEKSPLPTTGEAA
jgi:2-keto-4-pentenoate hydratase/2-oxohepta-3-ene-1,7-dioic acid hydratase in catechol pathway